MGSKRGFSSMDPQKQREIASKGGKAAHQKGTAHEFTTEEARVAGRKGGAASRARRTGGADDNAPAENGHADNGASQAMSAGAGKGEAGSVEHAQGTHREQELADAEQNPSSSPVTDSQEDNPAPS